MIQDWGTGVGAGGSVYVRGGSIALHSITTSNTGVRGRSAVYYDTSFSQDTGSPDYQADLSPATPTLVPTHVAYTYGGTHVHAVVSLSTGDNYQYDANGNMIRRVAGGITQTLIYNGENRLSEIDVAGAAVATFVYDGDGNKVSQTINGVTTAYFAGGALEVSGGVVKKYYAIGGQLVAMDSGGTLSYFLTDNLGSVVAVLDASGTLLSQQRYLPFGQVRTDVGQVTQTDHGYTGQKLLNGLNGLMDYNARVYDSYLNRFLQPDDMVSNPSNPQTWNRYSYTGNNPINFTDPTGHCSTFSKQIMTDDQCEAKPGNSGTSDPPLTNKGNKGNCKSTCDGARMQILYLYYRNHAGWWNGDNTANGFSPQQFLAMMIMFENGGASSQYLAAIGAATSTQLYSGVTGSDGKVYQAPYCQSSTCANGIFNFLGAYSASAWGRYNDLLLMESNSGNPGSATYENAQIGVTGLPGNADPGSIYGTLNSTAAAIQQPAYTNNDSPLDWGSYIPNDPQASDPGLAFMPNVEAYINRHPDAPIQGPGGCQLDFYGQSQNGDIEAVYSDNQRNNWENNACQ